jgi:hypothetical protein
MHQGKLEAEARQELIQRGQELKDKLAALEDILAAVRASCSLSIIAHLKIGIDTSLLHENSHLDNSFTSERLGVLNFDRIE